MFGLWFKLSINWYGFIRSADRFVSLSSFLLLNGFSNHDFFNAPSRAADFWQTYEERHEVGFPSGPSLPNLLLHSFQEDTLASSCLSSKQHHCTLWLEEQGNSVGQQIVGDVRTWILLMKSSFSLEVFVQGRFPIGHILYGGIPGIWFIWFLQDLIDVLVSPDFDQPHGLNYAVVFVLAFLAGRT